MDAVRGSPLALRTAPMQGRLDTRRILCCHILGREYGRRCREHTESRLSRTLRLAKLHFVEEVESNFLEFHPNSCKIDNRQI